MSTPPAAAHGGVPTPQFALAPEPATLFARRAERLRKLAEGSPLAPYLGFLAALADTQHALAEAAPPAEAPEAAPRSGMPPLDRARLAEAPEMAAALGAFLGRGATLDMPAPARLALEALAASPEAQAAALGRVLADRVAEDAVAADLFAAAAAQVEMARRAAVLDDASLAPVATGICPACGGQPVASIVAADLRVLEGTRYACCATCATRWNEVRIKCLACGSLKGIAYRGLEAEGTPEPAIKAETCSECGRWLKIMYQIRDAGLDPVADDVASLGLDLLMRETEWSRAGFHPFLAGY